MKTQTKSVLVLLVTLLVGIGIGAIGWSIVHNQRMDRLRTMRGAGGLYHMIEAYTTPTDATQEAELRDLTTRYQERFNVIFGDVYDQRRVILDSMRVELRTILTPEQQQDMSAWLDRRDSADKSSKQSNSD
ncbi:MAG: hypothetical protein RIE53_04630 [Rhodothermales bacterium]